MKIKEVAEQLKTTSRTIRYYEERGLVHPEKEENDYRHYSKGDIERLGTIMAFREFGVSIREIKTILENDASTRGFLEDQRSKLFQEMLEVKDTIQSIETWLSHESDTSLHHIADKLKKLKEKRKIWEDQWNFDCQAVTYDDSFRKSGYDFNVHKGYDEALSWVVDAASVGSKEFGVDIGIGTGNLASKLFHQGASMIGVDQSIEMLKVCQTKFPEIDVRQGHFLALPVMDRSVDFVVSSYALHHLTDEDKKLAIQEMDRVLNERGRILIADLMFENEMERQRILTQFEQNGNFSAIEAIEDEYYGNGTHLVEQLTDLGYQTTIKYFHEYLHGIYALKTMKNVT